MLQESNNRKLNLDDGEKESLRTKCGARSEKVDKLLVVTEKMREEEK